MKLPRIEYVNYGVGSRFKDEIILNKNLLHPNYKELHDSILEHELSHSSSYTKKDLLMEFSGLKCKRLDYWGFILSHPSSWLQFIPFGIRNKRTFIDVSLLLFYSFLIAVTFLGIEIWIALR